MTEQEIRALFADPVFKECFGNLLATKSKSSSELPTTTNLAGTSLPIIQNGILKQADFNAVFQAAINGYTAQVNDLISSWQDVDVAQLVTVFGEAIAQLFKENAAFVALLQGDARISKLKVDVVDYENEKINGIPKILVGAGAPNANVIPDNWVDEIAWSGFPLASGQEYYDRTNNHWYKAKMSLSGSVNDWVALF